VILLGFRGLLLKFGEAQYVCNVPFPFKVTSSSRGWTQFSLPALTNNPAVSFETCIRLGIPELSIRLAVFTVSPNSWNRAFSPRRTPAVIGPLCKPHRPLRSPVDGPRVTTSCWVSLDIRLRQRCAKRVMTVSSSIRRMAKSVHDIVVFKNRITKDNDGFLSYQQRDRSLGLVSLQLPRSYHRWFRP
jgi:hypothetical protein